MKKLTLLVATLATLISTAAFAQETKMQKEHPNYFEAMNALRRAWWWIQPVGTKVQTQNQLSAEKSASEGWEAIHAAGIEYPKAFNEWPADSNNKQVKGKKERLEKAVECLESALRSIDKAEANFGDGVQAKAKKDTEEALRLTRLDLKQVLDAK